MTDFSRYIGIPFKDHGRSRQGLDCWGLIRLIYNQELDIVLPDYSKEYVDATDRHHIPLLVYEQRKRWKSVKAPEEYDVILININKQPLHVGCMINARQFIHVMRGRHTTVDVVTNYEWKPRIDSFYRYD